MSYICRWIIFKVFELLMSVYCESCILFSRYYNHRKLLPLPVVFKYASQYMDWSEQMQMFSVPIYVYIIIYIISNILCVLCTCMYMVN